MASAASSVFNTTRQIGGVLGSAIVGKALEACLAPGARIELDATEICRWDAVRLVGFNIDGGTFNFDLKGDKSTALV